MRHSAKREIQTIGKNDQKYLPDNSSVEENLLKDFLLTFKGGVSGFVSVFVLILISKMLAFGIQESINFSIKINDIIISFWGFLIISFIHFTKRYR